MTTTMQIYLTILVITIFVFIILVAITSTLSGYYYYEKISDVFFNITATIFFFLIGWVLWLGIAFIWHLY